MTAKQFIDKLEALGLLSPEIVSELRRQVEESKARISAGTLARLLVDNGHLTKFQATKLISETSKDAPEKQKGKPTKDEEDLGLAPDTKAQAHQAIILDDSQDDSDDEVVDVQVIDDQDDVVEVELIDDAIEAVEVVQPVPKSAQNVVQAVEVEQPNSGSTARKPKVPKRVNKIQSSGKAKDKSAKPSKRRAARPLNAPRKPGDNPWDSHRILTVGGVLALLIVFAAALTYYFRSEGADKMLALAEESYKPNNYEIALKRYESFVNSFPAHKDASLARVRIGMSKVRRDIESLPNPIEALKTVDQILPGIAKEPAIAAERGDVAGALIMLASKFNQRADNADSIDVKKQLMERMSHLNGLLTEAQYVGSAAREQFSVAMKNIEEDTKRIQRDILREEDLRNALEGMDGKLKENRTSEAYAIRADLLSRFPQLERDSGLMERVQEAARIQQTLVTTDVPDIKISPDAPSAPSTKSIVLANRAGKEIPSQAGRTICVAAKGTVYGLDMQSGTIRWRYFVGRDMVDDPLPIGEQLEADVVVCRPELGQLTRLEGATGKVKWFCELGGPTNAPRIDGDDMLVALKDGSLLNIEPQSGQVKWSARTPQPLQVTPAINADKPVIYVTANHQNMYVISRQDGRCREVFYLGHKEGAIAVPPVHLLGQLFVFENVTADKSLVRILQTDDLGVNLVNAQDPVEMAGNIVTKPLIDGRKLVVLSDRGQIKVFDIEPSNEKNKVSVLASEVGSESRPVMTWGVAENNQLWMTNVRFTRWDVQVSTGKLVRPWIMDEGDQFVGPPLKYDEIIVHRRIPRGNRGIRVTAVNAESAAVQWAVDIGVPVIHVASTAPGRYDAVLATGAQFAIDTSQQIINRAEYSTDSFKPAMNFSNPRQLNSGRVAFQNLSTVNRILSYSATPSGEKMRQSQANLSNARPTAPMSAVGDDVAVGLDNGQLLVIDPTTGLPTAKPFQPPVEPGKKHVWNEPAYQVDAKSLFATDSRRKLYRLAVSDSLRGLSEMDLDGTPLGPVALAGKHVAIVLNRQNEDSLMMMESNSLNRAGAALLDGRWQAGPFSIDSDAVLVQTDRKLLAYGEGAKKLWELEIPRVRLVGPPTRNGPLLALASTSGHIWLIDPAEGRVQSQHQIDQPLSAAPLVVPGGMLLGTDEGSVILMPKAETPVSTKGGSHAGQ